MNEMDLSFIEELLEEGEEESGVRSRYPVPEQHGPLRHFEKEMRCLSRRCGVSTYFKLQGIPMCEIHALRKMNDMLNERGVTQ